MELSSFRLRVMYSLVVSKLTPNWLFIGLISVTVVTSPIFTYEPFDNVKLFLLGVTAAYALAELITIRRSSFKLSKIAISLPLFFLFALLIPVFFSKAPFTQQIYGVAGRSLGFLHYFFLLCIFLGVVFSRMNLRPISFIKVLIATGLFEGFYGLTQFLKLDPIDWDNSESWVFGTFGNPNFLSAFLGLSVCASLFVNKLKLSKKWRYSAYLNIVISVFIIIVSDSIQGLFLVSLGLYVLAQLLAFNFSKIAGFAFIFLTAVASVFVFFSLLGKGVLARYLYQDSSTFRGDYWRAGFRMFKDNFLTGVGLDSYGDNYRLYRDSVAANRRGLDLYSTSAHNIYLDLASTGGVFLLLAFIGLNLFVFIAGFSTLKGVKFRNVELIVLMTAWIGFQAQLFISINVSSVAIWGFVISGLIVRESLKIGPDQSILNHRGKANQSKVFVNRSVYRMILLPLFAAMVFPLLLRDIQLASSISNSSKDQLIAATTSWPQSCFYLAKTEEALSDVDDYVSSLAVSEKSVLLNSKCFDSWRHIYENPITSEANKLVAIKKMYELDPNLTKD